MLLAVDIGNTQTVIGLLDDGRVLSHWRIATVRHRTADEIAGLLLNVMELEDWKPREMVTEVAIASVVPRLTTQWQLMSERHLRVTAFVIAPGTRTGMPIQMKNPHEVGADRVVNAVAAYEAYGGPCIVVDFGTATTFDVISADGVYLGGSITAGVEVSLEALTTRAARLVKIDVEEPPRVIGKSTVEALQSGAVYGFAGQVEGIVKAIEGELGAPDVRVIATGGLAELISRHASVIEHVDTFLTLRGIEIVLRRQDARRA
jgi:type III pantothenate kinase